MNHVCSSKPSQPEIRRACQPQIICTTYANNNLGKGKLDRAEAIQVLREILKECKDQTKVDLISLNKITSSNQYVIKFQASLDIQLRNRIQSALAKHNLAMKETNGSVIIDTSKENIPKAKCLI